MAKDQSHAQHARWLAAALRRGMLVAAIVAAVQAHGAPVQAVAVAVGCVNLRLPAPTSKAGPITESNGTTRWRVVRAFSKAEVFDRDEYLAELTVQPLEGPYGPIKACMVNGGAQSTWLRADGALIRLKLEGAGDVPGETGTLCWRTGQHEVLLSVSVGPQFALEEVMASALLARPACPR